MNEQYTGLNGYLGSTGRAVLLANGAGGLTAQGSALTVSANNCLTIPGATVTANEPLLNLSQTWNNAAVAFEGITLNVTNTASDAASALLNLQVGGVSYFKVKRDSTIDCVAIKPTSYVYLNGSSAYLSFNSKGLMYPSIDAVGIDVRNGVTAQAFNIYRTYTAGTPDYERLAFWFDGSGNAAITTQGGGTGSTARHLYVGTQGTGTLHLQSNNTVRFQLVSTGHLIASADNTYDIGASGATRPRTGYFGTSVDAPIHTFGGTTSSYPRLSRAAATIKARLADNSDYCVLQGKLMSHADAVSETITPTHTIILYDAAGVAYKVSCVAA